MNHLLIYPMAFYVFYMGALLLLNFKTRVGAVRSGEMSHKYFLSFQEGNPTDRVHLMGRHFDNQFQMPPIFMISCLTHMMVAQTNAFTLFLAWFFVATRLVHSWIHLGKNRLQKRILAYGAGCMTIIAMWIQLVYFTANRPASLGESLRNFFQ